ncbi:hypothetical protein [Bacillus pseudomycoides]|uniref:DUF805 domain-containing protein n=1 Tax=Bacillus pseudomycoides TaxID=64104 RepID=UPI001FB2731F|nr:hypothetical protein [Bacillus pseudomycoides]
MQWYLNGLKNYVEFQGKARRKEYWMFVLINLHYLLCIRNTQKNSRHILHSVWTLYSSNLIISLSR